MVGVERPTERVSARHKIQTASRHAYLMMNACSRKRTKPRKQKEPVFHYGGVEYSCIQDLLSVPLSPQGPQGFCRHQPHDIIFSLAHSHFTRLAILLILKQILEYRLLQYVLVGGEIRTGAGLYLRELDPIIHALQASLVSS